jgi:hypothetical protein
MSADLRRVVAKSWLKEKGVRDKWAPGAWQAAAVYNSTPRPEPRYPVIIGGDSFIKTADDLRDFCQLPSLPAVAETTTCSMMPLRNEKQREVQTVHIANDNWRQRHDLQERTEGKLTCLWFGGERRLAWLAWRPKAAEAKPEEKKAGEAKTDE